MHRGNQDSRAGMKQRALAATGLVATAAAGGMGVAAVTAAEAQAASGVVHACYSKSTHALKFSKGAKCPKGSKLVTWNKQGPQGATGAPGAQGPVAGWVDQVARAASSAGASGSHSIKLSAHVPHVAAAFTPTSTGYFDVHGFADIDVRDHSVRCWDQAGTVHTLADYAHLDGSIPVVTDGILAAGPAAPVYEICSAASNYDYIFNAEVTGDRLAQAHVTTSVAASKPLGRFAAKHSFSKRAH